MTNQSLCSFGYSLIEEDLKRLKKYTSLVDDLEKLFLIINKPWTEYHTIIDENRKIYQDGNSIVCYKRRGPITSHGLSPSNGIRLIYAIVKGAHFVPLLLFVASEEPKYPLRTCKAIIKDRVKNLKIGLQ